MENIKDEVIVEVSKEEKLNEALTFVADQKSFNIAKFLYQKGIYEVNKLESIDEEAYDDITIKTYKGYSLLVDKEGGLHFYKELSAEEEGRTYGYELISFPNVTHEQMHQLMEYKKPFPVVKFIALVGLSLFTLLVFVLFLINLFDSLSQGFVLAMSYSLLYFGAALSISIAALCIIAFLPKNKRCHCKK